MDEMLVELYGFRSRGGDWSWHYTLDYEMDRMYRPGLMDTQAEVIRFKSSVSLGQAERLRDRLRVSPDNHDRTLVTLRDRYTTTYVAQASTSSRAPLNHRVLDQLIRILAGRSLLSEELWGLMDESGLSEYRADWKQYVQACASMGKLELVSGMEFTERGRLLGTWLGLGSESKGQFFCRRCGSTGAGLRWVPCEDCGGPCPYCEQCLGMGKIRCCTLLIRGAPIEHTVRQEKPLRWGKADLDKWKLSPAQAKAARKGVKFLSIGKDSEPVPAKFLIWAVTGAGKTEMIFPLLDYELRRGRKVLVTTPRKDVVLELKPRLKKAFAGTSITALYGGSEDRWLPGDLTLSTTHQLLRFYRSFDLVIIDEIDAYPYHNNPMLIYAAEQVCKPDGHVVLLSATPPANLQKEAHRGRLPYVRVPVRYHRHPLPVPERISTPPLEHWVKSRSVPAALRRRMEASLKRGAQLFVFVPKIHLVEPLVCVLRGIFKEKGVDGTSSKDEGRTEKVVDFRGNTIDILVTTTILERGVTVPKTDVFILGADSRLFDEASLVQMAGRAGRSKDDPHGRVVFASRDWTRSQAGAVRQIREMNRQAKRSGYLVKEEGEGWNRRMRFWDKLRKLWLQD